MRNKFRISYCIGVYNEEEIIEISLKTIHKMLAMIVGKNNFEVVIVDNGSNDKTSEILSNYKSKNLTTITIPEKGHGAALRTAIKNARYEHIAITAIDLPFGFKDLKSYIQIYKNYDIVFGSKAHPKSVYNSRFERKVASYFYRYFLLIFFGLKIKDPQGSIFFKKNVIEPFLNRCDAKNAFFTSQIAIQANLRKLRMIEIPVTLSKQKRKSKYKILKDGKEMLHSLLLEFQRIHFRKNS